MPASRKYPDELRERATRMAVRARRDPTTHVGAIARVAEYVDWFNHRRLHGEIGLVPPAEFEDNFYQQASVSLDTEALVPGLP